MTGSGTRRSAPRRAGRNFEARRLAYATILVAAAGGAAAGCSSPSAVDELSISFTVDPPRVPSGGAFVARLVISNPTSNVISLLGLYDCIAFLKAFQDGREVALEGTAFDCPANFSRFPVPPRDSLVASYVLAARIRDSATSTYVPAPPGTYRLRADLNFSAPDREVEFQVVAAAGSPAR